MTCSSLTSAATAARQWELATNALDLMQNRGVKMDGISWSAHAAALASGFLWQSSLKAAAQTLSAWDGISGALSSTLLGACSEQWEVS